jgi:hypothetical protein
MKSAARQSQASQFESMDDGDYDRMVMKQLPSKLNANSYTFLTEHQLTPNTMKVARPYLQYIVLATKKTKPTEMIMWAFQKADGSAIDDSLDRLHGQMKADMTYESGVIFFQMNDVSRTQRIPTWSGRRTMSGNDQEDDREYHQQLFNQDSNEESQNQRKTGENNELPSRQSFGQHQAMRRFGSDSQSGNNAQCIMDSQFNIESFDGKKYKIPMSTCYTVLAKDCSSSSAPKFSVMAKKQSESKNDLKIKLLIPKKQFELYEENKGEMVIKMDGVKLRDDELEKNGIHKITETRRPTYVFHCSVTGMELRFDGRTTLLSISSEYINKQCGVCGHYNLDSEDTLRKEDNTLAKNLKEFHSSYLYRGEDNNEECTPAAQKQFDDMKEDAYHRQSTSEESSSESDDLMESMDKKNKAMKENVQSQEKNSNKGKKHRKNKNGRQNSNYELESNQENDMSSEFEREYKTVEPVRMTILIEEQDVVCFSKTPQKSCPMGSYPVHQDSSNRRSSNEQEMTEVDFICKPRNNSDARKFMRQVREQKIIDELKNMDSNKKMSVPQVKRCSKRSSKRMSADY